MIKLLLADDHTIVREGLKQLLAAPEALRGRGRGRERPRGARARARKLEFDLLLLDMSMPGKSGIELIKQVRAEKPSLRDPSSACTRSTSTRCARSAPGPPGYITKESPSPPAGRGDPQGRWRETYVSPALAERMALTLIPDIDAPPHTLLSDRQYQIFRLIVSGKAIAEVAAELSISAKTVSTHKSRIMEKMQMTNQTELIRYALEHHLLGEPA